MTVEQQTERWVLVPAAGIGARMGREIPKQYLPLAGHPLLSHTLENILSWPGIAGIVVCVADADCWFEALPEANDPRIHRVAGGAERADSVLAGLHYLEKHAAAGAEVLVHDAARPCIAVADVERLMDGEAPHGAILALPASDTVKQARSAGETEIEQTLDRSRIWLAQTPQRAPVALLRNALEQALADGAAVTDEASALEAAGFSPRLVQGSRTNIKVTVPEDLPLAECILAARRQP